MTIEFVLLLSRTLLSRTAVPGLQRGPREGVLQAVQRGGIEGDVA
jgi:hypothetical protein